MSLFLLKKANTRLRMLEAKRSTTESLGEVSGKGGAYGRQEQ